MENDTVITEGQTNDTREEVSFMRPYQLLFLPKVEITVSSLARFSIYDCLDYVKSLVKYIYI